MLIGAIGSDFWSAADLAARFGKAGLRAVLGTGGTMPPPRPDDEAAVVALRPRGIDPGDLVDQAVHALASLVDAGGRRFHLLTPPGLDTAPRGVLAPLIETLALALDVPKVIVCPAHPADGRTLYQGHLFLGSRLADETALDRSPDASEFGSDFRRILARQSGWTVGHVGHATVRRGAEVLRKAVQGAPERLILIDAVCLEDIACIAEVARNDRLVVGSVALAAMLGESLAAPQGAVRPIGGVAGPGLILCGSSATVSRAQAAHHASSSPSLVVDAARLAEQAADPAQINGFLAEARGRSPIIAMQVDPFWLPGRMGRDVLPRLVDRFFSQVTRAAVDQGYTRFVAAGSETAAAVARSFADATLAVGTEIEPGVPAMRVRGRPAVAMAWKSGNVGSRDLFDRALAALGPA